MDDKDRKLGGLLLAALLAAPDDGLARLRKQRIGRDSQVPLADLLRAREILEALAVVLEGNDKESWQRVHKAWKALHDTRSDDLRIVTEEGIAGPEPAAADDQAVAPAAATGTAQDEAAGSSSGETRSGASTPDEGTSPAEPELISAPALPLPDFSQPVAGSRARDTPEMMPEYEVSPWADEAVRQHAEDRAPAEPAAAPEATPPNAPPPAPSPPSRTSGTVGLPAGSKPAEPGPALPFSGQGAPPAPVRIEHSRAPTGTLDAPRRLTEDPTLPFAKPQPGAGAATASSGEERSEAPSVAEGATCADPTASLSLAGYAALNAVCEVVPAAAALTQTVYGVAGEQGRQELDQAWSERFEAAPALRELYDALHRQFCIWLQVS